MNLVYILSCLLIVDHYHLGKCIIFCFMLQTVPNQAIFSIQAGVCNLFREFLTSQGFNEIHTPKIISGLIYFCNLFWLKLCHPYYPQGSCPYN